LNPVDARFPLTAAADMHFTPIFRGNDNYRI
jgi:hypothetical protein